MPVVTPYFIYDDHRLYSKMYVLMKSFGLFCYTITLTHCDRPDIYIPMISLMFLSTADNARYEYRHYQRYNTLFSSLDEFERWKDSIWPNTRAVFSIIELGVKIGYFIYVFPPRIDFFTVCNIGKSILLIHTLGLFSLYVLMGILSCAFLSPECCYLSFWYRRHSITRIRVNTPPQPHAMLQSSFTITINPRDNEECCICLESDGVATNQSWRLLPCGHAFHWACITQWLTTHETCPMCRRNLRDDGGGVVSGSPYLSASEYRT